MIVTLEPWEWTALCPHCDEYNFIKDQELDWDGDCSLTITCKWEECKKEFDIERP